MERANERRKWPGEIGSYYVRKAEGGPKEGRKVVG